MRSIGYVRSTAIVACLLCVGSVRAEIYRPREPIAIGGEGGWDYLTIQSSPHRLFLSHASRVVVVDLDGKKKTGEFPGAGVHGVALAPELGRAFSTNGKEGTVSIVDLSTLKVLSKTPTGSNPDAVVYDPTSRNVFAFNGALPGELSSVTVIKAATGAVLATVALPGKPEFAVVDPPAQRIYVNIEDKNSIVALDSKTGKVLSDWPIGPCEGPSGLALDAGGQRLFSVCENKLMVAVDAKSGKVVGTAPIGAGPDGAAFDADSKLAFSANGEGTVTVVRFSQGALEVVETLRTEPGARTIALDPKDHALYLPTAKFDAVKKGERRARPIDGTQKILVYGR